jgi:hypothetical protein
VTVGVTQAPTEGRWAGRLLTWILVLWVVAIPIGWVSWAYLQVPVNEVISAAANDGHCTPAAEGVGVHCFGDYFYPAKLAASEPTWVYPTPFPHAYTASGMLPHVIADNLGNLVGSERVGLLAYLLPIVVALLVPALLLAVRLRAPLGLVMVVVLGVASQPFLLAVDRGNSAALAVPLLLWLAWATVTRHWAQVATAIVLASLLRPQFIMLALVLLALRQWRPLLLTGVAAAGFNALAFALWPGGFTANVTGWLQNLLSYSGTIPLERNNPTNLSTAHALTVLTRAGRVLPETISGWLSGIQDLVTGMPWLPGFVLLLLAAVVLIIRGRSMSTSSLLTVVILLTVLVPSLGFGYYLVVVLPIAAWLLVDPAQWFTRDRAQLRGLLDSEEAPSRGWRGLPSWLLVVAVALSLVPIPLAIASGENSVIAQNLGLLWTAVVLVLLLPIRSRQAAAPA